MHGVRRLSRSTGVRVEPNEIEETGEYDLDGLFIRLGHAIDSVGARRVVLDTLFGGLTNAGILRSELRRLFRWLKDKGVTAIITAERGDGALTRHGLEVYVSDCVIVLDRLVRFVVLLGSDVEIVVKPRARTARPARVLASSRSFVGRRIH